MDESTLAEAERMIRAQLATGMTFVNVQSAFGAVLLAEYDRRGAELDALQVQRDAVLALHKRLDYSGQAVCSSCRDAYEEPVVWPCDTAAAMGST